MSSEEYNIRAFQTDTGHEISENSYFIVRDNELELQNFPELEVGAPLCASELVYNKSENKVYVVMQDYDQQIPLIGTNDELGIKDAIESGQLTLVRGLRERGGEIAMR